MTSSFVTLPVNASLQRTAFTLAAMLLKLCLIIGLLPSSGLGNNKTKVFIVIVLSNSQHDVMEKKICLSLSYDTLSFMPESIREIQNIARFTEGQD